MGGVATLTLVFAGGLMLASAALAAPSQRFVLDASDGFARCVAALQGKDASAFEGLRQLPDGKNLFLYSRDERWASEAGQFEFRLKQSKQAGRGLSCSVIALKSFGPTSAETQFFKIDLLDSVKGVKRMSAGCARVGRGRNALFFMQNPTISFDDAGKFKRWSPGLLVHGKGGICDQ